MLIRKFSRLPLRPTMLHSLLMLFRRFYTKLRMVGRLSVFGAQCRRLHSLRASVV